MSERDRIFIGLGANLGEPAGQLREAARKISEGGEVRLLGASSLYRTEPVGPVPQPAFLNAVLEIQTSLRPRGVLDRLLKVEASMGRRRTRRWGPRRIDLDLLLYGREVADAPGLRLPHPRMHERGFVLRPLAELAPDARHPVLKKTAAELLAEIGAEAPRVERLEGRWLVFPQASG